MYNTRSSKQNLDSVSSLNFKTGKTSLSKNDDVKKKVFSISGRPVLRSKNISNRKSLNKLEKNNKINIKENKPEAAKTLSQLQKNKHKSLNKNQSCLPTVVNKENIINSNILKVFESNYKTNHVQVTTEQEAEHSVLNKRRERRKCSTNIKNEINTESVLTKSKNDQNKSHADISVNKENTNNLEIKFGKSLNLNENLVPKYNPVWKTCPNDNQESKKRTIDVYDITEDEDLLREGFHKKKKISKQTKLKVKKPPRNKNKNTVTQNQEKLPSKTTVSIYPGIKNENSVEKIAPQKDNLCSKANKTTVTFCPNIKNENSIDGNVSQKHNLQLKNKNNVVKTLEEVLIIDSTKETNREVTPLKEIQSDTKETFNEVTTIYTIDTEKQFHRPITPVKKIQPIAKQILSEATVIETNKQIPKAIAPDRKTQPDSKLSNETKVTDPNKKIHRETTPFRETQPGSEQTFILNSTDFDTTDKISIPPMTSTPENDVFSPATQYVNLGNSFFARMSEIPAIPAISNNKEVDGLEDELLYSNKPTCSPVKISLFESPLKMDKLIEKPVGSNLKQTNLNAFVEHYSKTSAENVAERPEIDSFNLFDSPVKRNKVAKSLQNLETSSQGVFGRKEKKPRKSYDNRDKIRVNIACWKKTCNKEKSVSEKKEEELVQSLNEHFSELENFELCIG